jgi:hypothetical protein
MSHKEHIDSRILKNITVKKYFVDFNDEGYTLSFDIEEMESKHPFSIWTEEGGKGHVYFSVNMLKEIEEALCWFVEKFKNIEVHYDFGSIDTKKESLHTEEVNVCLTLFISGIDNEYTKSRNALRLMLHHREAKDLHDFILLALEKYDDITKGKK